MTEEAPGGRPGDRPRHGPNFRKRPALVSRAALVLGYLLRDAADPDRVILFRAADVVKASAFVWSDEPREAMWRASRKRRS